MLYYGCIYVFCYLLMQIYGITCNLIYFYQFRELIIIIISINELGAKYMSISYSFLLLSSTCPVYELLCHVWFNFHAFDGVIILFVFVFNF
jgi:hypothetical protein